MLLFRSCGSVHLMLYIATVMIRPCRFGRAFSPNNVRSFRTARTPSAVLRDTKVDEQGRRIRISQQKDDGGGGGGGGWDEFDDDEASSFKSSSSSSSPPPLSTRYSSSRRSPFNDRSSSCEYGSRPPSQQQQQQQQQRGGPRGRGRYQQQQDEALQQRKINMNALESAGFVHLYGLAPVWNALRANRRDFSQPDDHVDLNALDAEEYDHETRQRERKPEAQFSPWLFVQEQKGQRRGRSSDKAWQEQEILKLAKERNLPIATVDKGVLNSLSGNRPHQGVCLRCGGLDFTTLSRIPLPEDGDDDDDENIKKKSPNFWLALDEVVDPQNLGALLRSVYFLGGPDRVGVLVCAKNSAPPSPTVSAASAGALELLDIYTTSNLPRTLATAEQDGFAILGASSNIKDLDIPVYDLHRLPISLDQPTILVLGSEGSGLRHLVAKSCTSFVRIPGASEDTVDGVDSLNVSVTGGILLWSLLSKLLK